MWLLLNWIFSLAAIIFVVSFFRFFNLSFLKLILVFYTFILSLTELLSFETFLLGIRLVISLDFYIFLQNAAFRC